MRLTKDTVKIVGVLSGEVVNELTVLDYHSRNQVKTELYVLVDEKEDEQGTLVKTELSEPITLAHAITYLNSRESKEEKAQAVLPTVVVRLRDKCRGTYILKDYISRDGSFIADFVAEELEWCSKEDEFLVITPVVETKDKIVYRRTKYIGVDSVGVVIETSEPIYPKNLSYYNSNLLLDLIEEALKEDIGFKALTLIV